jgi:energy-coupling factor transport system permease protein
LFQAGVVISIAITFVPQMVLSAKEIRQAQRIRGHRFRGIRDLLPLVMPLLASGLERAIQLAETMEARGFGSVVSPMTRRQTLLAQLAMLVALLSLMSGLVLVAFVAKGVVWGWVLSGLGAVLLIAAFTFQGRNVQRTRYRRQRWHTRDTVVVVASAVVVVVVLVVRAQAPETLYYSPYPPNSLLPPFNAYVGASLLLLALPAFLAPQQQSAGDRQRPGATGDPPPSEQEYLA